MRNERTFDVPKMCGKCHGTVRAGEVMIAIQNGSIIKHHCLRERCNKPKKKKRLKR